VSGDATTGTTTGGDIDTLRAAADVLRREGASTVELAVADWLTAEAAVVEAIPPLTELLFGMRLGFQNGLDSVVEVDRLADGREQLRVSSTAHGLSVALAVLASGADQ
jgi:hypothetical protein